MRRLDRYIARAFLDPFVIATAFLVGLYIIGDAFSNLDKYLENAESIGQALGRMARTYFLRIPTFLAPLIPVGTLLGGAYGLSQLSARNELTAMRACGISLWRILAPVYAMAVAFSFLGMADREYLAPQAEALAAADLNRWTGRDKELQQAILFLDKERALFIMEYNAQERRAAPFSVTWDTGKHLQAREAQAVSGGWRLTDAQVGEEVFPTMVLKTALRPKDVELALIAPDQCSLKTLRRLVRAEPDNRSYRLAYHVRLTYFLEGIVLLGLGLPFVITNERIQRSRLLGVGVCVVATLVFYTFRFIAEDLGQHGHLPAALAAWLPTVVFGALGLYLLETLHS